MLINEKDLIKQCQAGNTEAFGALYDHYIRQIYNFIYYKTFHKETAEDLTSESFFKALRNIQSFDLSKSFISWLYKIAQNTVLDHFRARRSHQDIEDFWDIADSTDIELEVETGIAVESLKKELQALSSLERDIIIMRVWQDVSYKDIAEIVGKSEASCKMTYSRALTKLRTTLPLLLMLMTIVFHTYG
jgi:RNA polymerase sigma-70 factor (ECF subfamily)